MRPRRLPRGGPVDEGGYDSAKKSNLLEDAQSLVVNTLFQLLLSCVPPSKIRMLLNLLKHFCEEEFLFAVCQFGGEV
jgi:hypothetical protein